MLDIVHPLNRKLPQKWLHLAMPFKNTFSQMGLVFRAEDDTVNSETETLGQLKLMPPGISAGVFD